MEKFCSETPSPCLLYAPSAPRNLITAIQQLRGIRLECPVVATTVLLKRETHLTFLSGEHVIFTLFDTKLTGEERQKIASRLLSLLELWEPGTML